MSFSKWLKGFFARNNEPTPEKELEKVAAANRKHLEKNQLERNIGIIKASDNMSFADTELFLKTQHILNAYIKSNALSIGVFNNERYDCTDDTLFITPETFRGCTIKREIFTDERGNKFPSNRVYLFYYKEGHKPKSFDDLPCVIFNSCNL